VRTTTRWTVTAAGLLALAGCSSATPTPTAAPATTTTAVASSSGPASSGSAWSAAPTTTAPSSAPASTTGSTPPCTAADVTASLGTAPGSGGQVTVPLRYTDTGSRSCTLTGYPGATLQGPDRAPYGPQYALARSTTTTPTTVTLAPGQAAVADLTLGTVPVGDPAGWQATALLTTAPDDTTVMTVPFPADTPVTRQDGATRPATYVGPFTGPTS
jgi:hypothetical protein